MFAALVGWRTILVNVGIFAGTAALSGLTHFDWVTAVGPLWSVGILTALNVALRAVTSTPVGLSK